MKVTTQNIVSAIEKLKKDVYYNYVNPKTKGKIKILEVIKPNGPIWVNRGGKTERVSISKPMLNRIADAIQEGKPFNIDRILGASYNTRSVLESLLAHTSDFYFSYPGRIENLQSTTKIKKGHKHLIWEPNDPHEWGIMVEKHSDKVISEIPNEVVYDALVPSTLKHPNIPIDLQRRHAQIQYALYAIGRALGSKVWIAQNDKSIEYKGKKFGEFEGMIPSLQDDTVLQHYEKAIRAALLIDEIWFKNAHLMPAVFEIEHSTGVIRGLDRMKTFKESFPPFQTKYVIVAPDELREKVYRDANKEHFKDLHVHFFPYTAVDELFSLCERRQLKGVTDEFLESFMEPCVSVA